MSSSRDERQSKAKILLFDIECTHLKADFGTILCVGWKWLDEKRVHVPAITDYPHWERRPWDDKRLIGDIATVLEEADIWVTYNGKRFDVPYIQSKLLEYRLPVLPNTPHVDLYWTAKNNTTLSRKSLANVSKHLQLKNEKTPVTGDAWKKAMCGDKSSIRYVVDHCKADVLLLEEAYLRMRPLIRQHPIVDGVGPCRSCGSKNIQNRGFAVTTKTRKRRIQCMDCGMWENREIEIFCKS